VFDQERFDELARGLATGRLTRWEVLKGLGAGVLLGSAGLLQPWSARFAEGQQAPVGSISNPRLDPIKTVTCHDFNRRIEYYGVTDEEGKNWPGWAGVTSYKCEWKQKKWHWKTFKCKNKNYVCVMTAHSAGNPAKVQVTFTALGPVTVVDWRPSQPQWVTAECREKEDRFMNAVVAHEQRHVNDINEIIAAANSSWRSKPPFRASAPRTAGVQKAVDNLRRKIEKAERDHCDRITSEIKTRAANFDANNKVPLMKCGNCGCPEGFELCSDSGICCNNGCCPGSPTGCCGGCPCYD
jgi:hypothetical protein